MLNILNLLKKDNTMKCLTKRGQSININKTDIPSNKEWYNSVYAFNKNSLRFLPAVHDYVFKLLKRYFNIISDNMEAKIILKNNKKANYSSGHKIWISAPEMKHLSDKLNITIYVYNRIYNVYNKKLEYSNFLWEPLLEEVKKKPEKVIVKPITKVYIKQKNTITNNLLSNPIKIIKTTNSNSRFYNTKASTKEQEKNVFFVTRNIRTVKQEYFSYQGKSWNAKYYTHIIKWLKKDQLTLMQQYKSAILELLKTNNPNIMDISFFMRLERYDYLVNQFKKELTYFKFKQKLLFNQFKFSELYMTPIIHMLQSIFKKKIKLNIVILKNYYLNSSILLQIIETKLRKSKARGRHLSIIDTATSRIKTPILSSNRLQRLEKINVDMQNILLNDFKTINNKDNIDQFLLSKNSIPKKDIHNLVLKNLKNKFISGLFIKISGRLTKRYKAQKALSTLRTKGTLKNVYSAHTGSSSVLSKGYSNINIEKTMIHSKNRIGAYGLTGWMASY